MSIYCAHIPRILMPKAGVDLSKWAVVACDQYTSQPEYWEEVCRTVGDAPSTLRLILPEVYLESPDCPARIDQIHAAMHAYLQDGTLSELPAGAVLLARDTGGVCPRRGLMLAFDLDAYAYTPGSVSPIRPTEKTVELMQNGGHLTGWFLPEGPETDALLQALARLGDPNVFQAKYGTPDDCPPLPYAVGDGNHSMATAKAYWEEIKAGLSPAERETHPARYVLAEVVNIHDESLVIEGIHRALFGIDPTDVLDAAVSFFHAHGAQAAVTENAAEPEPGTQVFPFRAGARTGFLTLKRSPWALPVASLQAFLDEYLTAHPDGRIDYIHGLDVLHELAAQEGNMGFALPDPAKDDLFRGVIFDGVLPRKTFSMGDAREKRFYMEARKITP